MSEVTLMGKLERMRYLYYEGEDELVQLGRNPVIQVFQPHAAHPRIYVFVAFPILGQLHVTVRAG